MSNMNMQSYLKPKTFTAFSRPKSKHFRLSRGQRANLLLKPKQALAKTINCNQVGYPETTNKKAKEKAAKKH